MILKIAAASLALAAVPECAWAQSQVAVHVAIPTPASAPRAFIIDQFEKSIPTYQAIPGIVRKYYTIDDKAFGGIYLWTSRAAAEAYYSPVWRARVKATYGADAAVSYYDVPVAIEGKDSVAAR